MPKKKGQKISRKRMPNVDLNYSDNEADKQLEKTNIKATTLSVQIQRQKVLEFLGGNQMPKNFNYREKQTQQITKYIQDCMNKKNKNKYRILMVTGSPGAGKTLSVNHILQKLQKEQKMPLKVIKFNANVVKTVRDAQQIICNQILGRKFGNQMSTLQIIRALEQEKMKKTYVLYIQEVEIILQQKTNIFTEDFFCLFSNPKLDIMLLGISNTIDAMAKYSKSICVNLNQIKNVVFEPYPLEIIIKIMKQKIDIIEKGFGFKIIIPDKILGFTAAKIQNMKRGDIRIVLQFLKELASNILPKTAEQSLDIKQEGYMVSMSIAQKIFSKMRSSKNDIILALPHTQQIVLIAIYLFFKENDSLYINKKDTIRKTKWICQSLGLEFHPKIVDDGIEMLEQYSLITRKKKTNEEQIFLKISLNQVQSSMEDHQLFKRFFEPDV